MGGGGILLKLLRNTSFGEMRVPRSLASLPLHDFRACSGDEFWASSGRRLRSARAFFVPGGAEGSLKSKVAPKRDDLAPRRPRLNQRGSALTQWVYALGDSVVTVSSTWRTFRDSAEGVKGF